VARGICASQAPDATTEGSVAKFEGAELRP
jgi:hypothetical protein